MTKKTFTVLTTINPPHHRIKDWQVVCKNKTIVVGDQKTPSGWNDPSCIFIDINSQKNSEFKLAKILPDNHYTRKNFGYLYAIANGADSIIDTDDDNFPILEDWENFLSNHFVKKELSSKDNLTCKNIYTYFSSSSIPFWPRGYPIEKINCCSSQINVEEVIEYSSKEKIVLWQCMVNGDPDIDAIHRLIFSKTPKFENRDSLVFSKGNYCPFNSQNTLWQDRQIFPLLYLPSTVSFRFTDILRGFIAQAIFQKCDFAWGFHKATAFQDRNDHELIKDFDSEVTMYLQTNEIINILNSETDSSRSVIDNLHIAYKALEKNGFVLSDEIQFLEIWLEDIVKFTTN